MVLIFIDLIQLIVEAFAFLVGLICFNYLPTAYKLIAIQLIAAFIFEFSGYILRKYGIGNVWLFNIYIFLEAILLIKASRNFYLFNNKLFLFLAIPIFFWFYSVFKNGFNYFTSIAYVSFSIAILIVYLNLLFKSVLTYRGDLVKLPTLWLAIGVILFFGCNIPYLSMLNYLCNNFNQEVNNTLHLILKTFCNLRYILMAISLIMASRQNQILSGR